MGDINSNSTWMQCREGRRDAIDKHTTLLHCQTPKELLSTLEKVLKPKSNETIREKCTKVITGLKTRIKDFRQEKCINALQQNGTKRLKDLQNDVLHHPPKTTFEIWKTLQAYATVFNHVFFRNRLPQHRCHVSLVSRSRAIVPGESYERGHCNFMFDITVAHITIYKILPSDPDYCSNVLQIHVDTLLYEMLHAYLKLYWCECHKCINSHYLGLTGYGKTVSYPTSVSIG